MVEAIEHFFLEIVGRELCVFFCSMIPIIELRGGIPLAAALGLPFWQSYIIAVIGNLIPVPFILLFIRAILKWMNKVPHLCKVSLWLEKKADKHKEKVEKYSFWGLFIFVAIPIPGTGAWTGSLVAALINTRFSKAMLAVTLGVLTAGVIMTLVSYGILGFLSFLV